MADDCFGQIVIPPYQTGKIKIRSWENGGLGMGEGAEKNRSWRQATSEMGQLGILSNGKEPNLRHKQRRTYPMPDRSGAISLSALAHIICEHQHKIAIRIPSLSQVPCQGETAHSFPPLIRIEPRVIYGKHPWEDIFVGSLTQLPAIEATYKELS
jgi:hypothetical protein